MFDRGLQTPRTNKSTRPTASCFHLFLGVWIPRSNTRTRFWFITSYCESLQVSPSLVGFHSQSCHVQRNPLVVCLNCNFSEFRLTLCLRVASSILQKAWSCSGSVEPHTTMSSAIPITLGMSLYTSSSLRWKMSWESLTPKGNRLKRYRPKGVLNVHSKLDSWSRATCQ